MLSKRVGKLVAMAAFVLCGAGQRLLAAELSLTERIAAARAIAQVYASHREPAAGAPAAPVDDALLQRQVLTGLRQSVAVAQLYEITLDTTRLDAELERMARQTKAPARLTELFATLGNDRTRVLELLVRPILAERLLRHAYETDPALHRTARQRAEAIHAALSDGSLPLEQPQPGRRELRIERGLAVGSSDDSDRRRLDPQRFDRLREELGRLRRIGPVLEDPQQFSITVTRALNTEQLELVRYEVPKRPFDEWWREVEPQFDPQLVRTAAPATNVLPLPNPAGSFTPPTSSSAASPDAGGDGPCGLDDLWDNGALDDFLVGREGHAAIWTGFHLFIWGGFLGSYPYIWVDDGARYDPATDSWLRMTRSGSPSPRDLHGMVWTGTRIVVWGGRGPNGALGDGAVYDPFANSWSPTAQSGAPSARIGSTATWVGNRMIVWGGYESLPVSPYIVWKNDGALYDPTTNSWSAMSATNAPAGRAWHTAIGTGNLRKLIVWGGENDSGLLGSGGTYNLTTNSWTPMPIDGAPRARYLHSAVWAGTEMIIWGGYGVRRGDPLPDILETGGRFNPNTSVWTGATNPVGAPSKRANHSAIWTGSRMILWGGEDLGGPIGGGAAYDPATNSWSAIASSGEPAARRNHIAVWTGQEMLVWGGYGTQPWGFPGYLDSGGRYRPSTNSWSTMALGDAPAGRVGAAFGWSGSMLLVWGGERGLQQLSDGARYDLALGSWLPISSSGAPSTPRRYPYFVWSGSELLIWGGTDASDTLLQSGARYNPLTNSWSVMSAAAAPAPRRNGRAVWTGSSLLLWGGEDGGHGFDSGGLYNPLSDQWSATSLVDAPRGRAAHVMVWAGDRALIWGGRDVGIYLDDGATYDPLTGQWAVISAAGAPVARQGASAVWTGREMLIWGGATSTGWYYPSGGRYDAAHDQWRSMSDAGSPGGRIDFTAIWTGTRMLVWGGQGDPGILGSGAQYDPVGDRWTTMTTTGGPLKRTGAVTVRAGGTLLIWGGSDATYYRDGGLYGKDLDADGAGDSCDCAPADGGATITPGEIAALTFASDRITLRWSSATYSAGLGSTHDLIRGSLAALPVTNDSPASCLATQQAAASAVDGIVPPAGSGSWYLVRGRNSCGIGSYGTTSSGAARLSQACP